MPHLLQWPAMEAFRHAFRYPGRCELTIHQPVAANACIWGCLAARR